MLKVDFGQDMPKFEIIPTPSFGLNRILDGGFYTGRYHVLWGNYSAGKSTMAFQMAAEAQKMGYKVVIIDAEQSYDQRWAEEICGLQKENRLVLKSCIEEDILDALLPLMKSKEKIFLIIDSINAIVNEGFYKEASSGKAIGTGAKTRKHFLQKIAGYMDTDKIVVIIAQQGNVNAGQFFILQAQLGEAEKHWTSNTIKLFKAGGEDDVVREALSSDKKWGGKIIDREIRWTVEKSKQRPVEGAKGAYWFNTQIGGIDTTKEIVALALRHDIIVQKGAWYNYGGEQYQGIKKLLAGLSDVHVDKIKAELLDKDLGAGVQDAELQQDGEETSE